MRTDIGQGIFTIAGVLTPDECRAYIDWSETLGRRLSKGRLGIEAVTFGANRRALAFGAQKINSHEAGRELEPKAATPTPGSADLCSVTTEAPAAVLAHLDACGVEVIEGPVMRTGARGPIASVYFRDPDGNLIEVSSYVSGEHAGMPTA